MIKIETNLKKTNIPWIPEIPSNWDLKRIKLLFDFNKNIVGKSSADYSVLSLTTKGVIRRDLESGMGKFPASFDGYQIVNPNSIMLCLFDMDVTPRVVGHVNDKGIISAAYTNIIPRKGINSKYYYYYFLLQDKNKIFLALGTGIRITLSKDFFGCLKIPVPPLEVQNSIVEYLDKKNSKIDKFIQNKEKLIKLLEEQKKRKIVNVITTGLSKQINLTNSGIEWFGSIPSHWLITKAKFISKIFIPDRNKPELNTNDGIPWVTTELIGREILDINLIHNFVSKESGIITGNRTLPKNSVIANCIGTFGCSSYVLFECLINQQLQAYTDIKINPFYLRFIIQISETYFNRNATQTTLMYVNKQVFSELPILFPPLDEQNQMVDFITEETTKIDLAISKAQKEIAAIKEYREALITDLVTGKRNIPQIQRSSS